MTAHRASKLAGYNLRSSKELDITVQSTNDLYERSMTTDRYSSPTKEVVESLPQAFILLG